MGRRKATGEGRERDELERRGRTKGTEWGRSERASEEREGLRWRD